MCIRDSYNGIKLKAAFGGSASPGDCKDVERRIVAADGALPRRMEFEDALVQGLITRFDPFAAYETHVRTLVDFDKIAAANLTIAVDEMCIRDRSSSLTSCPNPSTGRQSCTSPNRARR